MKKIIPIAIVVLTILNSCSSASGCYNNGAGLKLCHGHDNFPMATRFSKTPYGDHHRI